MVCQSRAGRIRRSAGLVALFLLGAQSISAELPTELSEQSVAVGERLAYIITIDHEEPTDVTVRTPEFPGLRVIEGPTIRPVSILAGNERQRAVEVRFSLEAVTAGRYVLPAVPVSVAGQPYLTGERLVEIGLRRNRNLVPFLARWTGPGRPFYVGEARVYTVEIYNVPEYLYPSSVTLGTPQNAIIEEVQGLGTIEQYTVDGVTLYSIPVAVFMVTASQSGVLMLPRAELTTESLSVSAAPLSLDVRPLPEAVESTGAVGRFELDGELQPASILRSETMTLRVRLSGRGNLHFLALPDPEFEGLRLEREATDQSLVAVPGGYEGYVERTFVLRPEGSEVHRVSLPALSALDPASGTVDELRVTLPAPTVLELNEPLTLGGEPTSISLLSLDEIASLERRAWYNDPLAYGWLVPGLIVFVASRLWKRRHEAIVVLLAFASLLLTDAVADRLPWDLLEQGMRRYEEGDIAAAASAYERAARAVPDAVGINHNLSVLYFKLGDTPRAVFAAREAIRLAPLREEGRALLRSIEEATGVERSVPPPHVVHPDVPFFILAGLVNLTFIWLAFIARRRRASTVIVGVFAVLLILGSTGALVVTSLQHGDQLGVVRGDVTLKRIPGPEADGWLPVPAGSAVRVVARTGGSLLVRTVAGLEGWVELRDLLWPGNPAYHVLRYRGFVL